MCKFLPVPPSPIPLTIVLFDADTGDTVQRLVGLNRSKSDEWCEYPFWRRVICTRGSQAV